jgi:phosphatidylinositol glycan class V
MHYTLSRLLSGVNSTNKNGHSAGRIPGSWALWDGVSGPNSYSESPVIDSKVNLTGTQELGLRRYIVAGIVMSNACHLLSVIALYQLLTIITGSRLRHQIAFVAANLHIMTTASLFLSAPYTEAPFSLLNLTGMLLYAQSRALARTRSSSAREDAYKLGSGILFASGTLLRSNGLLSGLILLCDVARYLPRVVSMQLTVHDVRRIVVTCMSGVIVALGYVWPQYLAYTQFCTGDYGPSWCEKTVPSIYSWVQSHYW